MPMMRMKSNKLVKLVIKASALKSSSINSVAKILTSRLAVISANAHPIATAMILLLFRGACAINFLLLITEYIAYPSITAPKMELSNIYVHCNSLSSELLTKKRMGVKNAIDINFNA